LSCSGRRLSEIIRLIIAVDSEPLAKVIARVDPAVTVPSGMSDIVVPKGLSWTWLVLWLVMNAESLPTALIPDVSKVFQSWLISTQNQSLPLNAEIVGVLFQWLALIEGAMTPRMWQDRRDAPLSLNIRHVRDVRDEIRMTAFALAHLNPLATPTPSGTTTSKTFFVRRARWQRPRPRHWLILRSARSSKRKSSKIRTVWRSRCGGSAAPDGLV
jgi:hypothetical protein